MKFNVPYHHKRSIGVYQIKNLINNKIYIGSTSMSFYRRYNEHKKDYKAKNYGCTILKKAFYRHGIENFEFSIVCICEKADLLKSEQFYIDKGTDYNCCPTAGNMLGYKHPNTSKTRTVTRGRHHSAKKIDQYTMDGQFIKTFDSIKDVRIEYGNSSSSVASCCNGKLYSLFGYKWAYHGTKLANREKGQKGHEKIKVALYKDGFYKEFDSQLSCAKYITSLGYKNCQAQVSNVCRNPHKIVHGFKIKRL